MPLANPYIIYLNAPADGSAPDPYLRSLRLALNSTFQQNPIITSTSDADLQRNARVMPLYTSVFTAFQNHIAKAVIRTMIQSLDVSDDAGLVDLQNQLLSLPEWTTDTSGQ